MSIRQRWLLHLLALVAIAASVQLAHADTRDVRLIVIEAAERHGASAPELLRVVNCESRFRPDAVGDYGTSFGLAQLNSRPTGLLWHFYAVEYTNPFDVHQAADYLARAFAGEWAEQGIGRWRWTCWRRDV